MMMQQKTMLSLGLIGLIGILIAASIYVFTMINQEQATTQTRADTIVGSTAQGRGIDSCGFIRVDVEENTQCSLIAPELTADGQSVNPTTETRDIAEYVTTFTLENISDQTRTVTYTRMGFFCESPWADPYPDGSGGFRPACIGNPDVREESVTLEPGQTHEVRVAVRNTSENKCGSFQTDIVFGSFQTDITIESVDGDSECAFPSLEAQEQGSVAAAGICQTGYTFDKCEEEPSPTPPSPTQPPIEGCGAIELAIEDCTCGQVCNPDLGEEACTDPNNRCIQTDIGEYYCTQVQFENTCRANPSFNTCCLEPTRPPAEATNTPIPTNTPLPTVTPLPTNTPLPSFTPIPTNTPLPTFTPVPAPPARVEELPAPTPQTLVEQQQITVIPNQPTPTPFPTYTPVPPLPTYTTIPTYTPIPTYTSAPPPNTGTPLPQAGNPVPWIVAGVPIVLMLLGMLL